MLDPELEAALDRMYEESLYNDEALELWDGPDAPFVGEMLWLSEKHRALLFQRPNDFKGVNVDMNVSRYVILLDEFDYVKTTHGRTRLLWVKVLTTQGIGWTRGAFLERLNDNNR